MPTRGILTYTHNQYNIKMALACRKTMKDAGLPITCVSSKPIKDFGHNIVTDLVGTYKVMFQKILMGLEAMTEDIVYFCEADDLYHPSHFNFIPPKDDTFYYNGNYWYIRMSDGFAIHYDVSPLSGLIVYRKPALIHFKERMALIEKQGFGFYMGFEPFTHKRVKWENWYNSEKFMSEYPNVDLCHGGNMTDKRWTQDRFIKKPTFWEESTYKNIPGWPDLPKILDPFFPMKDGKKAQ
jgi:hypothetical protein